MSGEPARLALRNQVARVLHNSAGCAAVARTRGATCSVLDS